MIEDLDGEIWKDIKDYEGKYQISNKGRVKSFPRHGTRTKDETLIKPTLTESGYLKFVNIRKRIQRLVAQAFIPIPEELKNIPIDKLDVNHKDENKLNNCVENLEWCTHQYNVKYSQAKKVFQYTQFGDLIKIYDSLHDCNNDGFDYRNVSACCNNKIKTAYGFIWSYKELNKESV